MAKLTMTEILAKAPHDIEREKLQNYLAAIDRDSTKLQAFIAELYGSHRDNPQILYAAATHLTALTYLEVDENSEHIELPTPEDASRAFLTYARLMAMVTGEKDAPLYANNDRIRRRLSGTIEELGFHAALSYSNAQGADFVALPTPAKMDFSGANEATDVRVHFADPDAASLEIQVGYSPETKDVYHPRIPVLSLATALGGSNKAAELRGLLKDIGTRDDEPGGSAMELAPREHDILMSSSAAILSAAQSWKVAV
jgi:hypothetical protein